MYLMPSLVCREIGKGRDFVVNGNTEEEVLQNGFVHASKDHGMKVGDDNWNACKGDFVDSTIIKSDS